MSADAYTTIEVGRPGARYALFDSGPEFDVHLAGPAETGGTGPCICGFDRFARNENGHILHGFSVGGGVTGPGFVHHACPRCAEIAGETPVRGTHAPLFGWSQSHGFIGVPHKLEADQ